MLAKHYTSTRSALSGHWAASPICVSVNIDAVDFLFRISVHEPWYAIQESAQSLECRSNLHGGFRHPPANPLAGVLYINPVSSKVIRSCCCTSECCMKIKRQRFVTFKFREVCLYARGAIGLAPFRPHSTTGSSTWRGSASYSMWSSHQRMMRFSALVSFPSFGPGPRRGPMVIS